MRGGANEYPPPHCHQHQGWHSFYFYYYYDDDYPLRQSGFFYGQTPLSETMAIN
jgi:hypothetical protein